MSNAIDGWTEAFRNDPENTRAYEALEEKYFLAGNWAALVSLYRTRLSAPSLQADASRAAALHFRLGQIFEERISDCRAAIESYWAVAQLQPDHHRALRQLRRIHARQLEWEIVLEIADLESQTPMPDHERASGLAEFGELWRVELDDIDKAVACFEGALALDPNQIDALSGLARSRAVQEQWQSAADLWQKVVGLQRGPDRAVALLEAARLLSGPLDQQDRASDCYRRALTDDPRSIEAVEGLVASATRAEQWTLLADLFERRFDLAAGARRRTEIALDASELQIEHLDNPSHARHWLDRAKQLSPDEPRVYACAAKIERRAGNTRAVLEALEAGIRLNENAGEAPATAILLEAATVCRALDDDERALDHLRSALLASPEDSTVAEELDLCLARLCRDADRIDVLERRVALADAPSEKSRLLCEIARLQRDVLEDEEASASAWRRAFDSDPTQPEACQEWLDRLGKAEDWEGLRSALEVAATAGSPETRGNHLHALGELALLRFEDGEAAALAFEQALELAPTSQRALEGLARIAASSGDDDAIRRAYAREAEATTDRPRLTTLVWELVRIHEARDEWKDALHWLSRLRAAAPEDAVCLEAVVRIHEQLQIEAPGEHTDAHIEALHTLEQISRGEAQARVRLQLARLHSENGRREDAIRWLEASLDANARQLDAAQELVDHYRSEGHHEDRARVQRRLAELLPPQEQASCMADLAQLLEEQFGDLDGAIVILWDLANRPASDIALRNRLTTLLERAGRYEELVQQLLEQRRALGEFTPNDAGESNSAENQSKARAHSDAARALDLRRAELLLEPLGRFEEAAIAFRALHESDPGCDEALDGLERALRADHDSPGLARLLSQRAVQAEAGGDRKEARRLQLERAVLLDDAEDSDPAHTRLAYAELADQSDDASVATEAGARLEALLERCRDWPALRERLDRSVALSIENGSDPEERLTLHTRLAGICRDRLADPAAAIAHLEAAGSIAPNSPAIWQGLALLFDDGLHPSELQRALESELACDIDRMRKAALHARAARIAAEQADDSSAARRHYEALLDFDAGNAEASEFLIDHYGSAGQHDRLADLLQLRIERAAGSDDFARSQRTSLRLRLAALQSDSLDNVEGAVQTLRAAFAEEGAVTWVASPLAQLLQRVDRTDELIELCEATCAGDLPSSERASWQLRLADALRDARRPEEATAVYECIAATAPEAEGAKAALRQLYRQLQRPEPLAALLVEQLHTEAEGAQRAGADLAPLPEPRSPHDTSLIHLELAQLLAGTLARPSDALSHYESVLALEPSHNIARNHAIEIATRLQRNDQLAELLDGGLPHVETNGERAALLLRRGQLLAGALDRNEDAIATFREAVAADPHHAGTRGALREAYERAGRWSAALDCLFVEARLVGPGDGRGLLERGVALAAQHISLDATLPWLERLRVADPGNAQTYGRIADVHRQAGRPEALLRTLEHQITLCVDAEQRRALHCHRARILERDLHAPSRALAAYEAAHALDPVDLTVLRELARLRGLLGRTPGQVEALEALAEHSPVADRRSYHCEAAKLCVDELGDRTRARKHFACALALPSANDAERRSLLGAAAEAAHSDGDLGQWVEHAELELSLHEADSSRAIELRERLAQTYERDLAALERAAAHASALADWSIAEGAECSDARRDEIDERLIRLLTRLREPISLEARLTLWLARHPHDAVRALELARLRDEVLHATSSAAEAYQLAWAADPTSLAALRGLRACAAKLGNWADVATTLDAEVRMRNDAGAADRTALLRRLGDVAWHRLGDVERAASSYERALEADPQDLAALRALERLREAGSEHDAAAALYERECELLGERDAGRRTDAWLRAGELARDYLNDIPRALAAYDAAGAIAQLSTKAELEWADLLLASGAAERYAEVAGRWCDRDDSPALAADHLRLADHLTDLGDSDAALERTRRATDAEVGNRDAWDALARRCDEAGLTTEAAGALEHAANISSGTEASTRYVAAALAIEGEDASRALAWLRRAVESDSALACAHAHRARLAERSEEFAEAETAAGLAMQTDSLAPADSKLRLEAALVGGRIAKAREAWETAALFYGAALQLDAEHPEALGCAGQVLYALGDAPAARGLLERRLALDVENSELSLHLTIVAEGLELAGRDEEAAARFLSATQAEGASTAAHAGAVRSLERLGKTDEAIAALECWAEAATTPAERADALLRAGQLESAAGRVDDAEAHLRLALEASESNAAAWVALCELYAGAGRENDALEVAAQASSLIDPLAEAVQHARIGRVRASLLEKGGDTDAAAGAWGEVAKTQPRDTEAVLAQARLHRSKGRWREAATALADFLAVHPEPSALELARVHEEHARLLAGPLEEVEDAIAAYEKALTLDPERSDARAKLASLLAMLPGRRGDAVNQHRELLRRAPTASNSLRSLLGISEAQGADACWQAGLTILRSLGIATPQERSLASQNLSQALARDAALDNPHHERLRCAVRETAECFGALGASLNGGESTGERAQGFSVAIDEVQSELASSGLGALSKRGTRTLEEALAGLTALVLDPTSPHAETEAATALDRSIGRRALRRARKQLEGTTLSDVVELDAELWLDELRALSAAVAVDRQGGDLRSALVALVEETRSDVQIGEDSNLAALVEGCRPARLLLARVVTAWCERIAREI